MANSCFYVLGAVSLMGAFGFFLLCRSAAKYFDRAEKPEHIDLGIGVVLKDFLKIRLDIRGGKTPDSKKDHTISPDDDPLLH